jgi:hypothetical protein
VLAKSQWDRERLFATRRDSRGQNITRVHSGGVAGLCAATQLCRRGSVPRHRCGHRWEAADTAGEGGAIMGNQYSDASGGDLAGAEPSGGAAPPQPDGGGFRPGSQASAVPLPVAGGDGAQGREMRESAPLIGTPDDADAAPISLEARSAPAAGAGHGVLKTGTVHTRTHSFDAGEMGAREWSPCYVLIAAAD